MSARCEICLKDSSADHLICDIILERRTIEKRYKNRAEYLLSEYPWLRAFAVEYNHWKKSHPNSDY